MKTTLKYMLIIVLLVLSGTMQAAAVEYKNNYRGVHKPDYQVQTVSTAAPAATFQSTSAYSDSFEEQSQPMLNADGTVNAGAYGVGQSNAPGRHIRTATPNPDVDPNDPGNVPLGDGLIALMLCACAYLIVRATRKEEKIG